MRTAAAPALAYRTPSREPPGRARVQVADEPDQVTRDIAERFAAGGLRVTRAADGIVVAEYRGDPSPYVDCGSLTYDKSGRRTILHAAAPNSTFKRRVGPRDVTIRRDLLLNARHVAQITGTAEGSLVDISAIYTLTRNNEMYGSGGTGRGVDRQTISFASDEQGRFRDKGTVCQANGLLERLAVGTPAALARLGPSEAAPEVPASAQDRKSGTDSCAADAANVVADRRSRRRAGRAGHRQQPLWRCRPPRQYDQ